MSTVVALTAAIAPVSSQLVESSEPAATAEAVAHRVRESVYPALVNIRVVYERFVDGRTQRYPGAGSGVILTDDGHVLTNYHVAGGAIRVECTLTDGRVLPAEIVVDDPLTDLTVLRLLAEDPKATFPAAQLASDDLLAVGDTVFAMGNPLSLSSSMTRGIVSNQARVFTDFTGTEIEEMTLEPDQLSGLLTRWIQHDALILPGNSGGPLVDEEGRVVGINELGGRGIGFAIPASIAADVLRQALELGQVERGWLGISILPVAKAGRREGALVSSVLAGSAAATAGLEPGDLLLSLDGEPVQTLFFEEVPLVYQKIADYPAGTVVDLAVERDGAALHLAATIEPMPRFKGKEWEVESLGVAVQEITSPMAITRRFPDQRGLLLNSIRPGSPADGARPRLAAYDVLLAINGQEIGAVGTLARAIEGLVGQEKALIEFRRGDELLVTLVPAPADKNRGWGGELPKAWLGIETQVLTRELSVSLGLAGQTGFRVSQVFPWTEAAAAGVQVGDVIIAVDGEPTEPTRSQESEDLRRLVEERTIGEPARLSVVRDGAVREIAVRMEPRPRDADEADTARQETLDFVVRDVTFADRIQYGWDREQGGVLVTEAATGGWGQMAGLKIDDLIQSINGHSTLDVAAFGEVSRRLESERPPRVEIFVQRGYRTHFVFVEPEWKDSYASD